MIWWFDRVLFTIWKCVKWFFDNFFFLFCHEQCFLLFSFSFLAELIIFHFFSFSGRKKNAKNYFVSQCQNSKLEWEKNALQKCSLVSKYWVLLVVSQKMHNFFFYKYLDEIKQKILEKKMLFSFKYYYPFIVSTDGNFHSIF